MTFVEGSRTPDAALGLASYAATLALAGMGGRDRLEAHLEAKGRELLRQLFQDQFDLRASNEVRIDVVVDAEGVGRGSVEADHERSLATVFGEVVVSRLAYRRRGQANLHPADAALNLPAEKHSHGLRRLAALEASRGSFDGAVEAIERSSGQALGKRQVFSAVSCTAQAAWAQPCSGQANRAPRGKSNPRSRRPAPWSNSTEVTRHGGARPNAAPNISFKSSPSSKPIAPSSTAPAMPPEPIKGWSKINQSAHTI